MTVQKLDSASVTSSCEIGNTKINGWVEINVWDSDVKVGCHIMTS